MNSLAQLLETAQELAAGPITSLCGGSQLGDLGSKCAPEQDPAGRDALRMLYLIRV